jgi:hypothetical protein
MSFGLVLSSVPARPITALKWGGDSLARLLALIFSVIEPNGRIVRDKTAARKG